MLIGIEENKEEKERIDNLVDDFMGDPNSEDNIIEIISNNKACWEAIMDLCCHRVPEEYIGKMSHDKVTSLARSAKNLIDVIGKHAKGYVK